MTTFNTNLPANSTAERTQFSHSFQTGIQTAASTRARPTGGQMWPRGTPR